MTALAPAYFAVRAISKDSGRKFTLRIFKTVDDASAHALKVKMDLWDDVFVEPFKIETKTAPIVAPPFPWSVLWCGGYAYVVDANSKKIASLLGSQEQREFVAAIICDLRSAQA